MVQDASCPLLLQQFYITHTTQTPKANIKQVNLEREHFYLLNQSKFEKDTQQQGPLCWVLRSHTLMVGCLGEEQETEMRVFVLSLSFKTKK